jgi:hypothetical protein
MVGPRIAARSSQAAEHAVAAVDSFLDVLL